jgi:hypothetical protein
MEINENKVKISFDKLISLYGKEEVVEVPNNNFIDDNFCNKECYNKFLNLLAKIKNKEIDINNLNLSDSQNNLLANMLLHYYNSGYIQANINN